jgi:rhodanese-related sulfurtransferase
MLRSISFDRYFRKVARKEKVLLLDLRDQDSYEKNHIREAISIPFDRLDSLAAHYLGLPGPQIVLYAGPSQEDLVQRGASRLNELGYRDVLACNSDFSQLKYESAPTHSIPDRFRFNFIK